MSTITIARCTYHADRPAFARCMSCSKMLCQECATQWDGINLCVHCLALRGRSTKRERRPLAWIGVSLATAALFWIAVRAMLWIGAFVTSLS